MPCIHVFKLKHGITITQDQAQENSTKTHFGLQSQRLMGRVREFF
jgi:hypothetical protein